MVDIFVLTYCCERQRLAPHAKQIGYAALREKIKANDSQDASTARKSYGRFRRPGLVLDVMHRILSLDSIAPCFLPPDVFAMGLYPLGSRREVRSAGNDGVRDVRAWFEKNFPERRSPHSEQLAVGWQARIQIAAAAKGAIT
jgi:hypothetical protein